MKILPGDNYWRLSLPANSPIAHLATEDTEGKYGAR